MKHITQKELLDAEKQYRTNLMNCLSGPRMAVLVGTTNGAGQTNLAIFNSTLHIGAHPPLVGLIFRPDSVDRHTLTNIRKTGQYTINAVGMHFYEQAHHTSARYPAEMSEFDAAGLTPMYSERLKAPYVGESTLRFGLKLKEEVPIQSNGTWLVIGEVQEIWLKAVLLKDDGSLRLDQAGIVAAGGLDHYYSLEFLAALPYAKPKM